VGVELGGAGKGDLAYALRLLASGQPLEDIWREAGFRSRRALAERIYELAEKVPSAPRAVIAYSDGASIGNPGEAGCGAALVDAKGETLLEDYKYLGQATNNVAEYNGAILALERALALGATEVELRLDSALLVNQIKGGYRVKSRRIAGLYQDLMKLVKHFDRFEVTQIDRNENKQADRLANLAISARKGGGSETG
jgi:ribonuclease HI